MEVQGHDQTVGLHRLLVATSSNGGSTCPATSFTISLTNAVRLLKCPLVRDILGLTSRVVVF